MYVIMSQMYVIAYVAAGITSIEILRFRELT